MILQPAHNLISAVHFMPRRNIRAVDHQYLYSKVPSRIDLRARSAASSIFRNDKVNAVLTQKREIVIIRKRSPGDDRVIVGKRQRFGRLINQPQQIKMLRMMDELIQVHTTDGQKNPLWRPSQTLRRIRNIRCTGPSVFFRWHPWCARQCDQRRSGFRTSRNCIVAHLRGKRMGRVNHMRNSVFSDVYRKPAGATKSANTRSQGLRLERLDPTREGHNSLNTGLGKLPRQGACFNRAPKQKEVLDHV